MFRSFAAFLAVLILFTITSAQASQTQPDPTGVAAAQQFLVTLDNQEFLSAWNQTGIVNQSYQTYPEWFKKVLAVRPHLGQALSRVFEKHSEHSAWVGLPDGEYLRISFATSFLNKAEALETVVLVKEQGEWLVSAYFLR